MMFLLLVRYISGGNGFCTDGSALPGSKDHLPCFWWPTASRSDCESTCNKLEGCVAFDIQVNANCNLRFGSKDALLASPNPSSYGKWWNGSCGNNCKNNYKGAGGKGHCWVKNKGSIIITLR